MHPQVSICNKVSTYQPFTKENPKQTRHNPKLKKSPPPSAGTNHTPSSPPPRPNTPQIRTQIRKSTPLPRGPPPYPRTTGQDTEENQKRHLWLHWQTNINRGCAHKNVPDSAHVLLIQIFLTHTAASLKKGTLQRKSRWNMWQTKETSPFSTIHQ